MIQFAQIDLIALFFFLGVIASALRSDLKLPDAIINFVSIFLLLSLGLKGGNEVRMAESLSGFVPALFIGVSSCIVIPVLLYVLFKKKLGDWDTAALGACYGSVSAVTFIAALGFLQNEGLPASGYMVAIMALMEIPAIVIALLLLDLKAGDEGKRSLAGSASRVMTNKSVVLLIGGFVIGLMMNEPTWKSIKPVVSDAFKGVLVFYLLDLGVVAQRQLKAVLSFKRISLLVGFVMPILFGTLTLVVAYFLGIQMSDGVILAVLAGSASYIAAPASIRLAVPQANPSLYVSLPLALTFPLNIVFGIPFYVAVAKQLWV